MSSAHLLDNAYLWMLRRPRFQRLNEHIHTLALRSLGVLNWENSSVSGETSFISRLADIGRRREAVTIFDVGGHYGEYVTILSDALPDARIFSFEPNPLSFKELCNNTSSKPNIQPINVAVGQEDGETILYDHDGGRGTGHASLIRGVIENVHGGTAQCHNVKLLTLDSFLTSAGIQSIDLLKIDVEGNEANVLRGCPAAIKEGRIAMIQFEFNEMNLSSRVYFQDFIDLLVGYKFFRLLPKGMIPLSFGNYQHFRQEVFAFQNIVAILIGSAYDSREMTGVR